MGGFSGSKKKKLAVAGLVSILLVAMVVAVTVTVANKSGSTAAAPAAHDGDNKISATAKAVKAICNPTDYKETCEQSLSNANSTDPKELIKVVFQVAVKNISDVIKKSTLLKEAAADPRTKAALQTCNELLDTSIDDLQRSFEKVGSFDITKVDEYVEDLKTWLSAAITYQETCIDGFENTTGDTGEKMKKLLKTAAELSSNGLAMVTDFSSVLSQLQIEGFSRKLLSEEVTIDYDDMYAIDKPLQKRRLLGNGKDSTDDEELEKRRLYDYGHDDSDYYPVTPGTHAGHKNRRLLDNGNDSAEGVESDKRRLYDYGHDDSDYYPGTPGYHASHKNKRLLENGNDSAEDVESEKRRLYDYGHDDSDYYPGTSGTHAGHKNRRLLDNGNDSAEDVESEKRRLYDYGHDDSDYYPGTLGTHAGHKNRRLLDNGNDSAEGVESDKRRLYDYGHDDSDYYPGTPGYHASHKNKRLLENGNDSAEDVESEKRRLYDYGHDDSDYYPGTSGTHAGHKNRRLLDNGNDFAEDVESEKRRLYDYGHDGSDYYPVKDPHKQNDVHPNFVSSKARRLLAVPRAFLRPNVVVAQDGSGRFRRISDALAAVPKKNNNPFVIFVKAGLYKETVIIPRKMNNIILIGEGPTRTIITGSKNFAEGTQTFHSATVAVNGDDFIARDIGFENTAGPQKHQAVALRVSGDRAIFQNVHMNGFQDTLYAHSYRQYYRNCLISGTIDFIFGDAVSVFHHCRFVVRKPMNNQACMVTAQGRKDPRGVGVIVIQDSDIVPEPAFTAVKPALRAYLGRPWKEYSRTIIMRSFIDGFIDPEGWSPWAGTYGLNTLYYGEYQNRGAGSNLLRRVRWKGIRKITPQIAQSFTAGRLYQGDQWIKSSGVSYSPGF